MQWVSLDQKVNPEAELSIISTCPALVCLADLSEHFIEFLLDETKLEDILQEGSWLCFNHECLAVHGTKLELIQRKTSWNVYSLDNCLQICFHGDAELKDMVKMVPNRCYPRAVLLLLASAVPKTKMRTQNFLNSKVITEKSDVQTMIITGSSSYPRSLAVWCCTAWELEEYLSFCWWSSTSDLARSHLFSHVASVSCCCLIFLMKLKPTKILYMLRSLNSFLELFFWCIFTGSSDNN